MQGITSDIFYRKYWSGDTRLQESIKA